jgi:predicted TIM-barrel fold metal-dependent hydrolase
MRLFLVALSIFVVSSGFCAVETDSASKDGPSRWRAEHRLIDMHQHITGTEEYITRAVRIMDNVGLGVGVNLSGGTVTRGTNGSPSAFDKVKRLADELFPGRFVHYMNLDYKDWDKPDFSERAARQVEEGFKLGAAGLKEFKRLGLYLRDGEGKLIKIDDPKLDAVWSKCAELGMPVSIHVADPKAFWLPYNDQNERWKELRDHRPWWFGDTNVYPPRMELLGALNRVISRHPKTRFVCVHFANNAEELEWVDESLTRYPNMMADLAARIPEIGRHDPDKVRQLFIKHQDRIVFGTDFQVDKRLILGSSGNEPAPTDDDARVFYEKHWRWLETRDRDWAHMTPIQGDWTISSIGLSAPVVRKIYFDNARKLLARSLPVPVAKAARVQSDFKPDGKLTDSAWNVAKSVWLDAQSKDSTVLADIATEVKILWSDAFLYLGYRCAFTTLTTFEPAFTDKERQGLWDRDVVEAFINADPDNLKHYTEFEIAPTNEKLDLILKLPDRDFDWSSGFESAVHIDDSAKTWQCEVRIPLSKLASTKPAPGTRWRINLYRCDRANKAFLAWSPTLTGTFHTPERFGILEFQE